MADESLNLSATTGVYSKYSGKYVEVKNQDEGFNNGSLDFDGYLQLLVAQMSNQDFNDPMSDADLLNQMAQYSMLEGIKDMTQQSAISYGASLVGKVVTVSDGRYYHTGTVDSINVENGEVSLLIDGQPFKTSEITDIVNMDAYNSVKELLGKTIKLKGSSDDSALGVVTGMVFVNGQGHVAIGDKTYRVNEIEVVEVTDDENNSEDKTEGTDGEGGDNEGVDGAENNGETSGTESTDENNTDDSNDDYALENGQVSESTAASYAASAEALTDLLMRELDRVDEVNSVNASAEQYTENFDLEEIMKTAYVQVPEYAASAYADMGDLVLSAVDGVTTYANGDSSVSGVGNVSISDYNRVTGTGTLVDDKYTEVITDDSPTVTTTSYNYSTTANTSPYTASGKLRGVTAAKGISQGDGVPHRISVEQYPEEAALADELGTRMYDISKIHNHEVTSRILTGPVITRTSSGKGVTEIGYSGVGQLGEVVTFEDGTQRVEILLKSGKSTWLYTSGKYTLDQICSPNGVPGSLSNMTGAEKAIRYYADPNNRKSGSTILSQLRNA